jgi:uncharacterized repeat protein (TIGR01451 family)
MLATTRPQPGVRRLFVAAQIVLLLLIAVPMHATAVPVSSFGLNDKDFRSGTLAPTSAQRSAVSALGARASWTRFGTPASLIRDGGWLATGLSGSPATAARNWIRSHRTLFRLTDADVTNLEQIADIKLRDSAAHVVQFRQRYGSLPAGQDGLLIVGITGGKIAYVSSSASGSISAPQPATLSPAAAWIKAAVHVGHPASLGQVSNQRSVGDWTVFSVAGFVTPSITGKSSDAIDQRARLVAVPTLSGARAAYEANVLDTSGAEPVAYTVFVDARNGNVLMRYNQVDHFADVARSAAQERISTHNDPAFGQFAGTTDQPNNCGVGHAIPVPAGTRTIDIVASADIPANDITIALDNAAHVEIATNQETGTSPEALHYDFPAPAAIATTYYGRVCQFTGGDDPFAYSGLYATNDVVSAATDLNYPPKWKYSNANPSLANDPSPEDYDLTNTDTRVIGCWVTTYNGATVPDCSNSVGSLQNLASRVPWDHLVQSNTPSYTTIGNNAISGEAWTNPLAPGATQQRPVHMDRLYIDEFTNAWNDSRCDPTNLTPGGNDIYAAATSLFAAHNRMHDWSYFLGFTEETWNLQTNNFGNNPGIGQENDPEIGQVQSGALLPVLTNLSRDNANQITLQDGVPGITNMYLWQPIAGAFYPPCVDGDYDFGIIAHEYTHAISNRMAGGPDANLTGPQAGAMGEAWGDLSGVEFLNEFGLVPTNNEDRYALGAYATGNKDRAIRNYNMSRNPLNYGNFGYDMVCSGPLVDDTPLFDPCPDGRTEEHSDAEIWMAVNFDIRQALISKYNGSFPASNNARQKACAQGVYPASQCPGNRRWIQIMYDAWLLMPAATSMLDARDAYLASDMMRFNGANQKELWRAFARRGMGADASTISTSDIDPVPSFRSPKEGFKSIKFRVLAADEGNALISNAKIFVGRYEAGSTPVADTIPGGSVTDTAKFVAWDNYEFLVVAPGFGHVRFERKITGTGTVTVDVKMSTNRASLTKGAVASGTGANFNNMFDDTEATNWTGAAPVNAQYVTVDLQGGVQNVKRVNVSALLNPENGGRFHALRQFEIWTCNGNAITCANNSNYTKLYTSPANAFPGVRPRPVAPDLQLRSFDVPDRNATHVQLRVVTNQCTATGTGFRGDQDADPLNDTDCVTGSDADLDVKAAELQVFSSTPVLPARDPAVVVTTTAPATVATGSQLAYTISYTNAGPNESTNAVLRDVLPEGVSFVSATGGGKYNATSRTVTWSLGTVNVAYTGTRSVTVSVTAPVGTLLSNEPTYTAAETTAVSLPAVTEVGP